MYRFKMKRKREIANNLCKESLQSKIEKILTVALCKIMQKRTFAKDYFVILLFFCLFLCFCFVFLPYFCSENEMSVHNLTKLVEEIWV